MRARWGWLAILPLAVLASCTRPRTQLVVAVDTDMTWGPTGALRAVQITVRSNDPEGQLRDRRVVELNDAVPLPASFGVVPLDDDPSRRVWIEVRGCGGAGCDAPLVTRQAYVGFVEGQTLLLQMTLAGVCQRVGCAIATETCLPATGACGSARVEATALPAWMGRVPRADAGVEAMDVAALDASDAGEAAAVPSVDAADVVSGDPEDAADVVFGDAADARDVVSNEGADVTRFDVPADVGCGATCGGACVDLRSDPNHCGGCGRACGVANATAACVGGACAVGACASGFGDCDGNPASGCERDLRSDTANCGRCGVPCAAGSYCESGTCRAPAPGLADQRININAAPEVLGADAVGNLYVVGVSYGEDLGSGTISGRFIASMTPAGTFRWARSLPNGVVDHIAVDGQGNTTFFLRADRPDFGAGMVVGNGTFLASYSSAGSLRWARFLGEGQVLDVAAAANSGVILLATGAGVLDFGAGPSSGPAIVQLASSGAFIRRMALPVIADINAYGRSLSSDPSGRFCLAFYTEHSGTIDLGGGTLLRAGVETGNLVVACYGSDAAHEWSRRLGPIQPYGGTTPSVQRAADGSLLISGALSTVNDAVTNIECAPTSPLRSNLAVMKFDSTGRCAWGRFFEGAQVRRRPFVAVDSHGNSYVAGTFNPPSGVTTTSLGSGSLPTRASFVASFNSLGAGRWSAAIAGTGCTSLVYPDTAGMSLIADRSVAIAGRFAGRALLLSSQTEAVSCSGAKMYMFRIIQ